MIAGDYRFAVHYYRGPPGSVVTATISAGNQFFVKQFVTNSNTFYEVGTVHVAISSTGRFIYTLTTS